MRHRHTPVAPAALFTGLVLALGLQFLPAIVRAVNCTPPEPPTTGCATTWICPNGSWICQSPSSTALENPLGTTDIVEIFARVAGGLNFVTGTLALVFVVLGGYRILTAAGNSEHFQKGRQMVAYAILGLILTVGSYTLLATTISVLTGTDPATGKKGPPSFITSPVLVDPLNLRNLSPNQQAAFVVYGERILGFLLSGLGALSVLMFVYAGVLWLTAAGNEERIGQAKKTLLYATLGIVLVLSSYVFINFVYTPFYYLLAGG